MKINHVMKKLHYRIEIRDCNGKPYKTDKGSKILSFDFTGEEEDETIIHLICQRTFEDYKAVCKENSQINIEVTYFNDISKTFCCLYSFYGGENKFIKHD